MEHLERRDASGLSWVEVVAEAGGTVWKQGRGWYRFEQDERLGQQVAQEVVVGQSDALKVSGGVDLLQQLGELGLQHVHLVAEGR